MLANFHFKICFRFRAVMLQIFGTKSSFTKEYFWRKWCRDMLLCKSSQNLALPVEETFKLSRKILLLGNYTTLFLSPYRHGTDMMFISDRRAASCGYDVKAFVPCSQFAPKLKLGGVLFYMSYYLLLSAFSVC